MAILVAAERVWYAHSNDGGRVLSSKMSNMLEHMGVKCVIVKVPEEKDPGKLSKEEVVDILPECCF